MVITTTIDGRAQFGRKKKIIQSRSDHSRHDRYTFKQNLMVVKLGHTQRLATNTKPTTCWGKNGVCARVINVLKDPETNAIR